MAVTLQDFRDAVRDANRAAVGDSNDAEIEALQGAVDIAMALLGVTDDEVEGE